ncbi:MAG: metallophosphoesterase family protein [Kiritimatiellaeota bacterium]|nr:metallophosphoesterase family protein [Kiritimatiellota bacterium]
MRYAIISDLHANKQALKAVLTDIKSIGADQIVCLGDVVGYGPNPAEVLELAYNSVSYFVLGNHDAVVAQIMSPDCFNDKARRLIDWTCSQLDSKAEKFFREFPLMLTGENFRCAHGEFENPRRFGYVLDNDAALKSFDITLEQLLFIGHSHVPGIFVMGESGRPHWMHTQDFATEQVKRYIVNVGSVGQPRDNDCRASYCIFDTDEQGVIFRRIPFDIDVYRAELKKQQLPESSSYFLKTADKLPEENIRDIIDFSPLSPEAALKLENTTQDLREEVEKLRSSRKTLLAVLVALLLIASALGALLFIKSRGHAMNIPLKPTSRVIKAKRKSQTPALRHPKVGVELISMPQKTGEPTEKAPLMNWTITLSPDAGQTVSVEKGRDSKKSELMFFRVKSAKPASLRIAYLAANVKKGMRFSGSAQIRKIHLDSGFIELRLMEKVKDGSLKTIVRREPRNIAGPARWIKTSVTNKSKEPIMDDGKLIWCLYCEFTGEILVRKPRLTRKE